MNKIVLITLSMEGNKAIALRTQAHKCTAHLTQRICVRLVHLLHLFLEPTETISGQWAVLSLCTSSMGDTWRGIFLFGSSLSRSDAATVVGRQRFRTAIFVRGFSWRIRAVAPVQWTPASPWSPVPQAACNRAYSAANRSRHTDAATKGTLDGITPWSCGHMSISNLSTPPMCWL